MAETNELSVNNLTDRLSINIFVTFHIHELTTYPHYVNRKRNLVSCSVVVYKTKLLGNSVGWAGSVQSFFTFFAKGLERLLMRAVTLNQTIQFQEVKPTFVYDSEILHKAKRNCVG